MAGEGTREDGPHAREARQIEQAIEGIEVPDGIPTHEDLKRIAERSAQILASASPEALALLGD